MPRSLVYNFSCTIKICILPVFDKNVLTLWWSSGTGGPAAKLSRADQDDGARVRQVDNGAAPARRRFQIRSWGGAGSFSPPPFLIHTDGNHVHTS
ncbi:hypothetical protein [Oryza sativa Japonica Group]|uniref:Uncharacterized protein n=1 Tax=Oryza sativa subsp. japonica TaxID=39947 RepID=Q5ZDW9_ORYSJ|nr:hypothetical protein [Oryza sativa Japonica Group]